MVGSIGVFVRCRCLGLEVLIKPAIEVTRDPVLKDMLKKVVKNLRDGAVEVGVLTGAGTHPNSNGATVAEIAVWNEFGTKRIKSRPFMRATLRLKKLEYRAIIRQLSKQLMNLKISEDQALAILGMAAESDVKETIRRLSRPANRKSTIRKKRSSNPLIDTGLLRQSIHWSKVRHF